MIIRILVFSEIAVCLKILFKAVTKQKIHRPLRGECFVRMFLVQGLLCALEGTVFISFSLFSRVT